MENDDYYAVFSIDSETPKGYSPLEDVKDVIERDLKIDKITTATKSVANNLIKQIENGTTFEQLQSQGSNYDFITNQTSTLNRGFPSLVRSNFVNGALINAKVGDVIGPVNTSRGNVIIFVKEVSEIDTTEYEVRKDIVKRSLMNTKQNQVFENWINDLQTKADIEDFRKYHF
jgi:hypothetical protein